MPTLHEQPTGGDFVRYEQTGYSRGEITLASGNEKAGTVLGKVTSTGQYVKSVRTATDGSENAVAVLLFATDASAAAVNTVGYLRHMRVYRGGLIFDDSYNTEAFRDAAVVSLAGAGIIAD
ncbi:MAG: head decoration protein [Pseudomonadota bacterium]